MSAPPLAPEAGRQRWWSLLASGVAMVALAAMILLAMGRTPWYRSGPITVWYGDAWGPQNSQQLTDPYTFTHLTHGVLLYWLLQWVARGRSLPARVEVGVHGGCSFTHTTPRDSAAHVRARPQRPVKARPMHTMHRAEVSLVTGG